MHRILACLTALLVLTPAYAADTGLEGFQFTVGIGMIHTGKKDSIVSTTVDNGTLRVTERQRIQNGLWLASHVFTDNCKKDVTKDCLPKKTDRFGGFVAAQLGGESGGGVPKIVQAIAIGLSYTYMTRLSNPSDSAPLIISLGLASVPILKLVGPYEDGKALPQGSNQPVLLTKNVLAPLIMVSYRFGGPAVARAQERPQPTNPVGPTASGLSHSGGSPQMLEH